ncbi:LysR substrate-binding domain-containing protein [Hylemonella gracilis]|uniref:LysR family transcriptional regulator n=1 Tax=Hylemonella gracilis ATCC 19624 TaxID=887062 RepID=F3KQR1_9BURK|nr:LysR substrate-binding domain-containing protein [Hylemonella gracilis]EGI77935.1 LysR family transcriptional regulator [Hylemonella gracilis ATCC 19624]
MDMRQLQYFVRVVESGSFSAAAAALHMTQPSLSRQVALLEADVRQRLLTRTGRGVMPTEAGQALLAHARQILEITNRAREELRELNASPSGRVVIGLPPRVALQLSAELVARFRERLPRAVLSISEGLSLHLREWLVAGRLDLALLFDPAPSPQLSYHTLLQEPLLLVAPPGTALPARVALSALPSYPVVLPSAPNSIRSLVEALLLPRGITLQVLAEVGAVQTVLALVERGVGSTLLPESALHLGSGVRLPHAPIGPPGVRNKLVLATPRAGPNTRLLKETRALLLELDHRAMLRGAPR